MVSVKEFHRQINAFVVNAGMGFYRNFSLRIKNY